MPFLGGLNNEGAHCGNDRMTADVAIVYDKKRHASAKLLRATNPYLGHKSLCVHYRKWYLQEFLLSLCLRLCAIVITYALLKDEVINIDKKLTI